MKPMNTTFHAGVERANRFRLWKKSSALPNQFLKLKSTKKKRGTC